MSYSRNLSNLAREANYSINLLRSGEYSYYLTVHYNKEEVIKLPIDAMDNTLAGCITKEALQKLGADKDLVLAKLAEVAKNEIGAKEFVVLPTGTVLGEFVPVEEHTFKRNRFTTLDAMRQQSAEHLEQYPEQITKLNKKLKFVVGMNEILNKANLTYQNIYALLEDHANFTKGKMLEYKAEAIEGLKARLHHSNVSVFALLDESNVPQAMIRSLSMENDFAYLSDEVINQNIISLDEFSGDTTSEKEMTRNKFLLAYFVAKVAAVLKEKNYLFIAAAGREDAYKVIGSQELPLNNNEYYAAMKFGAPGNDLVKIKEALIQPKNIGLAAQSLFAYTHNDTEDAAATPGMKL